jgi:hypothetical protein
VKIYAMFISFGLYVVRAWSFEHAIELFNEQADFDSETPIVEADFHEIIECAIGDEFPAEVICDYFA